MAECHEPLIRPGVKKDEEMSICSSTPEAYSRFINFSLVESDLKMSKSHANAANANALLRMCLICQPICLKRNVLNEQNSYS